MRKVIYCFILIMLCKSTTTFAQHCNHRAAYLNIINYLKNDTSLYSNGERIQKKKFLVAPYFIKTGFEFTCDFFKLPVATRDTACNQFARMDAEANKGYKFAKNPVLVNLPGKKSARFLLYFSKQFKNYVYCEIIPFTTKKGNTVDSYRLNHQGAVEAYMFILNGCYISRVRKGIYYSD
jgi:hypothetical protein